MVAEVVDQSRGSEGSWPSAELRGSDFGDRRLNETELWICALLAEVLESRYGITVTGSSVGWALVAHAESAENRAPNLTHPPALTKLV